MSIYLNQQNFMEPIMSLKGHTALRYGMTKFERAIHDRFTQKMYQEKDYDYEAELDDEDEEVAGISS
jgi:hypothetical protein